MKYLKYIALSLCMVASFTSCDDDDDATAPRLFRPVPTIEAKTNNVVATWDLIKGATSYELILFKDTGEENDEGVAIATEYRKETTTTSPFTFTNVEWDEKYALRIKAIGNSIESEYYDTKLLSVIYPTKLSTIRTVDESALITWKDGGNAITSLKVVPNEDVENPIIIPVSDEQFANGEIVVPNLTANSEYMVYAYSGDEQTMDTYEGRLSFKTRESENFDEMYGEGKYIDLRNNTDENILTSDDFLAQIKATEGMTVILKGGFTYKVSAALALEKSITFRTGLTLEGNATIKQTSSPLVQGASGANIAKISFVEIDIISDKAPVSAWEGDKGFGGRQVYNVNGSKSTVDHLSFSNCHIEGFRAIVRLQGDTDAVKKITVDGCTVNGIGDQAAFTTNNKSKAVMDEIEITNSTFTNIVQLTDLRGSANKPSVNIKDCTFCYAPFEGSPLFRLGSNEVTLLIENTIFGPGLGSTGSNPNTYNPATKDFTFADQSKASIGVKNSFRTNHQVAVGDVSEIAILSVNEKGLFADPEEDDYTIIQTFDGAQTSGALKWRMQ